MANRKLVLTYFDCPARAEPARFAFAYGGIQFEDKRITMATWEPFLEIKPSLPLGQLPILEIDGNMYCQGNAIARYAAELSGLTPKTPEDMLHVDMIIDTIAELYQKAYNVRWVTPDEAKKEQLRNTDIPKYLAVLENWVKGTYVLGDNISLADFVIYNFMKNDLPDNFEKFDTSSYPKLEAVSTAVVENEKIASYLASRK